MEQLKERLKCLDVDELVTILQLTSEDIVDHFNDLIEDKFDELKEV